MPPRELVTIGDLHAQPLSRDRLRRRGAMRGMGSVSMGQTNASFVAPSAAQVQANPPGDALANAAVALLSQMNASGVPSEHTSSPAVVAFQTAWNADPLSNVNGSNGQLSVDGGYGPNTQAALQSLSTGAAPAINSNPAPAVVPVPTTVLPVVANQATGFPWTTVLLVGAAAAAAWLLFGKKKHTSSGGRRRRRRNASSRASAAIL